MASPVQMQYLSQRSDIWKISYASSDAATNAKSWLESSPDIMHVSYNHPLYPRGSVSPNDELFDQQWGLSKIGIEKLWDKTTGGTTPCGDTIVVAVFDQGFDKNHEDLQNVLWANRSEIPNNGFDDDQNGYKDDYYGLNMDTGDDKHQPAVDYHGTAVASVIAANTDNHIGIAGVNWHIKLLVISSVEKDQALVIEAFEYIRDLRERYNNSNGTEGAFVVAVNNSWGHEGLFEEDFPILCGMFNDLGEVGIVSIGATENDQVNTDVFGDIPSDCSSDYLIVVTNTDQNDELAVGGFGRENVDLGAPGEQIRVLGQDNSYHTDSGTSFATPLVTGAIGLLYSLNEVTFCDNARLSPSETALDLKRFILEGVTPIPTLEGRSVSGGRLNLGKSTQLATSTNVPSFTKLNLYPNPTRTHVVLDVVDFDQNASLIIHNMLGEIVTGKLLIDRQDSTIFIGSLTPGLYVITMKDKAKIASQKIVVN